MKGMLLRDVLEGRFRVTPGCWPWIAGKDNHGYGKITHNNVMLRAHRASYETYVGPITDGLHVLHRCDNPACVNPDHLFLGTHADNMADKTRKGRAVGAAPGSECYSAKLTAEQATAIFKDPRKHQEIADAYSVSRSAVGDIKTGRTWAVVVAGRFVSL